MIIRTEIMIIPHCSTDLSNEMETMFLRLSHVSMKLMNTGGLD